MADNWSARASGSSGYGLHTSMQVEGLNELRIAMRRMPELLQVKVLAGAVQAGARVIAKEARARAPVLRAPDERRTPGLLRRMITPTRGKRNGSEASAFVRVRRLAAKALARMKQKTKKTGAQLDPFYWPFVEFGNSKGKAQPFIRPAFDAKKEAAVDAIKAELAKGIEAEAPRAGGRKL